MHLEGQHEHRDMTRQSSGSSPVQSMTTDVVPVSESHFSFDDSVHDGLHRFHFMALHDSFEVLRAVFESLRHRDVQVIVRLLGSQVLNRRENTLREERQRIAEHFTSDMWHYLS